MISWINIVPIFPILYRNIAIRTITQYHVEKDQLWYSPTQFPFFFRFLLNFNWIILRSLTTIYFIDAVCTRLMYLFIIKNLHFEITNYYLITYNLGIKRINVIVQHTYSYNIIYCSLVPKNEINFFGKILISISRFMSHNLWSNIGVEYMSYRITDIDAHHF